MTNTTRIDQRSGSYQKPKTLNVPTELLEELTVASRSLLLNPADLRSRLGVQGVLEKMNIFLRASYAEFNGIPTPTPPTQTQLGALQALVDQAQELDMGYGPTSSQVEPTDTPSAIATVATPQRGAGEAHIGSEGDCSKRI
jgi:hypothetical protein